MNDQHFLHRFETGFIVLLVACLLVLTCGQILVRNLFSITFLGTESLVRHLVLWIGWSVHWSPPGSTSTFALTLRCACYRPG